MVKQLDPASELVLMKLKKYNLIIPEGQSDSGEEAVRLRKKVKRGITDTKNDTIKLLITLVSEMNASNLKLQKKITNLTNDIEKLKYMKERSPRPMPDRAYKSLQEENERLRDELDFYKRRSPKKKSYSPPKPVDTYGTLEYPPYLICQDDSEE